MRDAWKCAIFMLVLSAVAIPAAEKARPQFFTPRVPGVAPQPQPLIPPTTQPVKPPKPSLPPAQFDRPYDGDLTIKIVSSTDEVVEFCDIGKIFLLGCARRNAVSCMIVLVKDELARAYGWSTGLMLRHEIAHCNGWPPNHQPSSQALSLPTIHLVEPHQRVVPPKRYD